MRRFIFTTFIILISILSSAYSVTTKTDGFMIQAGYGSVCMIDVEEIPAQSASYIAGMPFNIEEDIVQYGMTDYGRRIANISLLSNTPFSISVSGNPMQNVDTSKQATEELHYILTIQYLLGYYENGYINDGAEDYYRFYSRQGTEAEWNLNVTSDPETFLGTVDGNIYFMFDEETSDFIRNESDDVNLPVGNYEASVTITITSEGA